MPAPTLIKRVRIYEKLATQAISFIDNLYFLFIKLNWLVLHSLATLTEEEKTWQNISVY